jgi:hypothetical protein
MSDIHNFTDFFKELSTARFARPRQTRRLTKKHFSPGDLPGEKVVMACGQMNR